MDMWRMPTLSWDVVFPPNMPGIKRGDHLLDLGAGAGNDCFVARSIVGETGHVTGLDFTDEMLEKGQQKQ